jgi:hypothetical protein
MTGTMSHQGLYALYPVLGLGPGQIPPMVFGKIRVHQGQPLLDGFPKENTPSPKVAIVMTTLGLLIP